MSQNSDGNRVLIIGLDGATLDLLAPWIEAEKLPNLAQFYHRGARGTLRSTIQPMSPQAWVSFQTGVNPGKHGVYGFQEGQLDRKSAPISAASVAAKPFWKILSEAGRRVILVNLLGTYPPQEINGIMVTGRLTPPGQNYTFPTAIGNELEEHIGGYEIEADKKGISSEEVIVDRLKNMLHQRGEAADYLMSRYEWDMMAVIFTVTDEIQHFFWHYLDPDHPAYQPDASPSLKHAILNIYEQVDEIVGRLVDRAGDDTDIFVVSDHGLGPLYKNVNLNLWLRRSGFLTPKREMDISDWGEVVGWLKQKLQCALPPRLFRFLQRSVPKSVKRTEMELWRVLPYDWSHTKTFAFGNFGCIYLNVKGREPRGIVEPGDEYERLRDEIADALLDWENPFTGENVVRHVYRREDVYHGPNAIYGPDLLIVWSDYAYTSHYAGDPFGDDVFSEVYHTNVDLNMTGVHRLHGILMAKGPRIKSGFEIGNQSIVDIAPTVLHLMGLPVPDNMDGEVLGSIITEDFRASHSVMFTSGDPIRQLGGEVDSYSPDDVTAVEERLRDLGYL